MLISPGRSNLGERLKETFFGLLLCIRKKEGRQQLLCLVTAFPKVTHPATAGARTGLPGVGFRLMYIWSTPPRSVGSQQLRKAKPVPQTPPGTLRNGALGYAKRVASSFPNKRGVSVWREGDFYRAEWVLPSSCQEGLSGPPQGEPGLPLSIANEANGKVFTKKPPRPLPWPRSGSSILALDLP